MDVRPDGAGMTHTSTVTIESAISPGVCFHLHKPTLVRRAAFTRMAAEPMERLQRLLNEARALQTKPREEYDATRVGIVTQLLGAESVTLNAATLLSFLESVSGLVIDGQAPSVTTFIADAPDELSQECLTCVQAMLAAADAPENSLVVSDEASPRWSVQ
jgi:hypothetical protein